MLKSLLGIGFLSGLGFVIGANLWLARAVLAQVPQGESQVFLASLPSWRWLGAAAVTSLAGLVVLHGLGRRFLMGRLGPFRPFDVRGMVWLTPLLLLALPVAAVLLALSPLHRMSAPWLHLFVELRVWFLAFVVLIQIAAIASLDERCRRWWRAVFDRLEHPRAGPWLDTALAGLLLTSAIWTSPVDRFTGSIGDEPKYLRHMENWYQGGGMDITNLERISELSADYVPPLAANVQRALDASGQVVRDLVADAARLVGSTEGDAPPRSIQGAGHFVPGKRGGTYQSHGPGGSLMLFPAYFVDRFVLDWRTGQPDSAIDRYATNGMLVLFYLGWGVALFHLLTGYSGRQALSWLLTIVAMLSVPATAFQYQYYPEAAAGLVLTPLVFYVTLSEDRSRSKAWLWGLAAGYLPWLHLRFGLVAVVLAAAFGLRHRADRRRVVAFWAGLAVPFAALSLYNYHVTGSLRPWALWTVLVDSGGFGVMRGVHALPRLAFEASGGVLPIAPIYLLAIPGLLKFWRGRPIVGVTVSLVVAVVAALTAGHAWSGGGTTPGRLVAAVLPLLMLPVADAIVTWRASKTWIVLVAVLAVVSVDNGLTYNLFFDRAGPLFRYEGLSGWRTPLLFPAGVSWIDLTPSFVLWLAIGGFAFAANWLSHSTDPGMRRFYAFRAWTPPVALVFVVVATAGSLMVVTIGAPIDPRNLVREDRARTRLLTHHLDRPGGTMWSVGGRLDPVGVFPNPPDVTVTLAASAARAASRTDLRLTVQGKGGGVAWGTAAVDYGDGSKKQIVSIVGERVLTHRYEQPGVFPTRVEFNARGASVVETASIGVLPARDRSQRAGPPVPKLPDSLLRHPVSLEIDRIVFGEAVITIDCTVGWRHRPPPRGGYWVWMASAYLALTQPRLVAAEFQETDAGRRVQLTIPAEAAPSPGNLTALLVGVTMRGNEGGESISRSEPIGVNWPTASLVAGSPIEMRTADLHP